MTERQLIADLLSALEYHTEQTRPIQFSTVAIESAREHLRKPEQPAQQQEPDYWLGFGLQAYTEKPFDGATPVWTSPQPPAQQEPLTDERIEEIAARTLFPVNFARAIEAAHGIKGDA